MKAEVDEKNLWQDRIYDPSFKLKNSKRCLLKIYLYLHIMVGKWAISSRIQKVKIKIL